MRAIVEAVFQGGVFRPVHPPARLSDGARVRLTVESVKKPTPDEILRLAACVYEGLSESDIAEIEEMARHAPVSERRQARSS